MVFKPWEHRFDETALESDADDQIILFVPFTSSVRLKSIALLGPPDNHAPAHLKVFVNRTDIDFDSVESAVPTQEWELVACPPRGVVPEYPTRLPLFTSVRNLTIFISSSVGAETTKVSFIGLKGDYTPVNRNPIITNYEIAANPADHKTKASTGGLSNMIL